MTLVFHFGLKLIWSGTGWLKPYTVPHALAKTLPAFPRAFVGPNPARARRFAGIFLAALIR
jgi:hypothetical protein